MTRQQFGARFQEARKQAGWTQQTASDAVGLLRERLAEYESGKRIPPLLKLMEIIAVLELDPRLIFPEWFAKQDPKHSRTNP
jgi:transcriptional regulator with XRE-family HTH domain